MYNLFSNVCFSQNEETGGKQGKPEALVHPLSFTDARLLSDFTHMAQKMSEKTLRLDREHLVQELEQRSLLAELEETSNGLRGQREKSPSIVKEKLSKYVLFKFKTTMYCNYRKSAGLS